MMGLAAGSLGPVNLYSGYAYETMYTIAVAVNSIINAGGSPFNGIVGFSGLAVVRVSCFLFLFS